MPQVPEIAYLLGRTPPTGQHDGHDCVVVFDHLCVACHGFSALATARRGDRSTTVLFDVGPYGDVWLANAERLAVDLSSIDVLFLSHWHWDHSGGITSAVAAIAAARDSAGLPPLIVDVHPDRPDRRGILTPFDNFAMFPPDATIEAIEAAGSTVTAHADVHTVGDLFLSSGDIPRQTSYETGLPGHHTWRGEHVTIDEGIHDERFLSAYVRGQGTTVLTACSHAGVVNVGLEMRRLTSGSTDRPPAGRLPPGGRRSGGPHRSNGARPRRTRPTSNHRPWTLHGMASSHRTRERVRPDALRAERRRHALRDQRRVDSVHQLPPTRGDSHIAGRE